ncbi:glycosyltransferase [Paenibacillus sp. JX-17]|uniref:Glycosyltransferase n=1 Tax=Paenibacillus lacisoli TaxID=3064525 RepID=A0ABT9CGK5_9BACL|nr:glycosyltransferase [Paenibacillus sp. JX-17]MDO7908399.1 glycosyltransferase [Paenibacillus sp. JX-17]
MKNNDIKQNILIYRDQLLPPSETFIKSQAEGFQKYQAHFLGSRTVEGLTLDEQFRMVVNPGGMWGRSQEISFKLTGRLRRGMFRQIHQLNPRLLHAHFGPDAVLALPVAKKLNIPLIATFHGYDATTKDVYAKKSYYTHRNYIRYRSRLQQQADLFIAVSDFIKGKMLDQGFPANKIVRHYIGLQAENFEPNPVEIRKPIVLFVGRLVEVKGCSYLLKAMKAVQLVNPEVELVVIGDGPLRSELEQRAAKTLKNVTFLGTQPQAVVKSWMNRAKVFCVPSIKAKSGAEEGLGMVFLEANAMGLPVVSFATGGIPEAVQHNGTGYLAKERDWQQLASYILRLMEHEELWHSFSENGQKRVREKFNFAAQTREMENIYSSLLSGQTAFNTESKSFAVSVTLVDAKERPIKQIHM